MTAGSGGRPVIFGEVLFDCFPGGERVLGGAPFNVAWHLQGFGAAPLFISRIGDDALGARVRDTMQAWGMDLAGLQVDPAHPTGVVQVQLEGGQPSYHIVPRQAYDFVAAADAAAALQGIEAALLYHGTLALRHEVSRAALETLRRAVRPVCVDLNLRAPWWDSEIVHAVLHGAQWVKLNDEELRALSLLPPNGDYWREEDLLAAAQALRQRYGLELLVLTRGAAGACLVTAERHWQGTPEAVARVVDTVGAGDAFAAVALLGLLQGWSHAATLRRALDFAARICTIRGATTTDRELYTETLRRWQEEGAAHG